jgi:diguanylate cyclase (GGDEF)-like protein
MPFRVPLKERIGFRVFVPIALVTAVVILGVGLVVQHEARIRAERETAATLRQIQADLEDKATALADLLAAAAADPLLNGDQPALERIVRALLAEPDVAVVAISDAMGDRVAVARDTRRGEGMGEPLTFYQAVHAGGELVGGVRLGIARDHIARARQAAAADLAERSRDTWLTVAVALSLLLLGLLAAVLQVIATVVVRPLRALVMQMSAPGEGAVGTPVDPSFAPVSLPAPVGEIGFLFERYGRMRQAIATHTQDLERANRRLRHEVAEREQAERALEEEHALLQTVIDSVAEPIVLVERDLRVGLCNRVAREATDHDWKTDPRPHCHALFCARAACGSPAFACPMARVEREGRPVTVVHTYTGANGESRHVEVLASPVWNPDGSFRGLVECGRDITERVQAEQRLKEHETRLNYLAYHDLLTQLPNRTLFAERLQRAMARVRREGRGLAVMLLDLDRYKNVNDSLGHVFGDRLLKSVAGRLAAVVRETDTVARLGGDEFGVLLEGIAGREDVEVVAGKVVEAMSAAFDLEGRRLYVTPSMGAARYPQDGDAPEPLLRHADAALYHAKGHGGNRFQLFTPDLSYNAFDRLLLENSLRSALQRDELRVHYQPQIDLRVGRLVGLEALVRWQHPERGLLSPGVFIPVAEETGLIMPIGRWVLENACRQLAEWLQAGLPRLRVAVNLSAKQLVQDDLVEVVAGVLEQTRLPPDLLELELTESVLMHASEGPMRRLETLASMGVSLAIDDFGTGYSSLSYLKRFTFHRLKIDRGFVSGVTANGDDQAIALAVISLAHSMGLTVLAEGVEQEAQLAFLREHQCDEVQGYLLGRPMPPERVREVMEESSALPSALVG